MRTVTIEDGANGQLIWTLPEDACMAIDELHKDYRGPVMYALEQSMRLKLGILTDVLLSGDELLFNINLLEESLKRLVVIMQRNGGDV